MAAPDRGAGPRVPAARRARRPGAGAAVSPLDRGAGRCRWLAARAGRDPRLAPRPDRRVAGVLGRVGVPAPVVACDVPGPFDRAGLMPPASVRLTSCAPARPWFSPGSTGTIELGFRAVAPTTVRVVAELLDLDRIVARTTATYRLPAGRSVRQVTVSLPSASRHGYGIRAVATWAGGTATGSSAVEALEGWWESPRHAAVTEFRSAERTAAAVRALRDWHVTVVQLYDWMYRHYRYAPPSGTSFIDPLGRRVSHAA